MNKDDLINKFTQKILVYLEKTESFMAKEVPGYLEEILTFGFYNEVLNIVLSVLFLLISVFVIKYLIKISKNDNDFEASALVVVACFIGWIFCIVTLVNSTRDLMKIKTAPRVYLIDHVRGLK